MALTSFDSFKKADAEDNERWPVGVRAGDGTAAVEFDAKAKATGTSPEAAVEEAGSMELPVGERSGALLETTDVGACSKYDG